ncbi:preprotein translocase subunit SecE [Prochlorococcus sp. MIT 1223]|uniref:preprotein translocase subunit SecE n=1 Tax=Prochlorococcus sp. MIT 1223 TaxID=3096217 RepID=UPI0039C2B9DB
MTGSTSPQNEEPSNIQKEDLPPPKQGFIASTIEELKLVVWPTRQQLFSESIAVILMVTVSAATIAAISRFYGWAASQIFL